MTDRMETDCPFCGETVSTLPNHIGDCDEALRKTESSHSTNEYVEIEVVEEKPD